MKYQEIREAFPKCGIAVSKDGISVVFPQCTEPQFIVTNIDEEEMGNLRVFCELLEKCDFVRIDMRPGLGIRFVFCMGIPVDTDLVFSPLRRELSWDEVMSIPEKRGSSEFAEVFGEIDLNDDEAVLAGVREIIENEMSGEVFQISGVHSWQEIQKAALDFHDRSHAGSLVLENPDKWVPSGSAVFDFESDKPVVHEIRHEDMPWFIRLVKVASWLSLDGFSSNERVNFVMSFYS